MSLYFALSNATKIALDFGNTSRFMKSMRWSRFMSFHAVGAAGWAGGLEDEPQATSNKKASFFIGGRTLPHATASGRSDGGRRIAREISDPSARGPRRESR